MKNETTNFGFNYGSAEVTRIGEDNDTVYIGVKTPKTSISIRVTKAGSVIVYNSDGEKINLTVEG